jgi:hypothetical protein
MSPLLNNYIFDIDMFFQVFKLNLTFVLNSIFQSKKTALVGLGEYLKLFIKGFDPSKDFDS